MYNENKHVLKIDILGLSEVRWKGAGKIKDEDTTFIYSGGDSHSRGVGLVLSKEVAGALLDCWAISDRILVAKIQGRPFSICIIQVYAPRTEFSEQDIEVVYEQFHQAKKQCKSQ